MAFWDKSDNTETLVVATHGMIKKTDKTPKAEIEKAKAIFIDDVEIFLPLKDLIDAEKESERLKKEIANKREYIDKLEKKLSNRGFTDNAPKELVENEKIRLNQEKENIQKMQAQLDDL